MSQQLSERHTSPLSTQVMAHRGASRAEVENTVAAFRRAGEMGSHAVELDVRRTADGVLVVHHNPNLADGRIIADVTFRELRHDAPTVPTLGEALDACDGMWVNVEIKNDSEEPDFDPTDLIADETMALLLARDTDHRWLISCFRIETVDRCHAIAPHIPTAWLCVDVPAGTAADLVHRGHSALHPWVGALTKATIDECHTHGVQVNTWTCDDPDRMRELVAWGIDGICTNVPDVALDVLTPAGGEPGAQPQARA